ncbi:hypothetical protein PG997_011818 [Apiospora hydei]|uniref:Uncharacterized protein n=1 Tax=Apiospora hydei TaxID=1337664 RepID=A0ABR1V1L1_9PEZI
MPKDSKRPVGAAASQEQGRCGHRAPNLSNASEWVLRSVVRKVIKRDDEVWYRQYRVLFEETVLVRASAGLLLKRWRWHIFNDRCLYPGELVAVKTLDSDAGTPMSIVVSAPKGLQDRNIFVVAPAGDWLKEKR